MNKHMSIFRFAPQALAVFAAGSILSLPGLAAEKLADPAPSGEKTPAELKADANGAVWSGKLASINAKKAQGKFSESLAEAQDMLANPPYPEFGEGEKFALKTQHIPLLMAQPYADDAAGKARAQAALDYCRAAQAEKWDTIPNPATKVTAAYQLLAWYLVDLDGAMAELDRAIAVGTVEEQSDAWGLKAGVLVQYALSGGSTAEKQAEWGNAAIAACSKVLLLKPGHYGSQSNEAVAGALGIWGHIEKLAPQYMDPEDYLALCKRVLMSYPPPGQSIDSWADFISRVSFRKESLQ